MFARQDKKWLIASLREFPEENDNSDVPDRLKELSWLIGEWTDESGDGVVTTTGRWSDDDRYIFAISRSS